MVGEQRFGIPAMVWGMCFVFGHLDLRGNGEDMAVRSSTVGASILPILWSHIPNITAFRGVFEVY